MSSSRDHFSLLKIKIKILRKKKQYFFKYGHRWLYHLSLHCFSVLYRHNSWISLLNSFETVVQLIFNCSLGGKPGLLLLNLLKKSSKWWMKLKEEKTQKGIQEFYKNWKKLFRKKKNYLMQIFNSWSWSQFHWFFVRTLLRYLKRLNLSFNISCSEMNGFTFFHSLSVYLKVVNKQNEKKVLQMFHMISAAIFHSLKLGKWNILWTY